MGDASELDPGRFWRRMARLGAFVCTVATFIPYWHENVWTWAPDRLADWRAVSEGIPEGRSPLLVFIALTLTVLTTGPLFLLLCSPRLRWDRPPRAWHWVLAGIVWALAACGPYITGLMALPKLCADTETLVTLGIGAGSAYLFLSGFIFLIARDYRATPLAVFWLCGLAVAANCLAWLCGLIGIIGALFLDGAVFPVATPGLVGSLLLLLGWLMWWRAVRTAVQDSRRKTDIAPPPTTKH